MTSTTKLIAFSFFLATPLSASLQKSSPPIHKNSGSALQLVDNLLGTLKKNPAIQPNTYSKSTGTNQNSISDLKNESILAPQENEISIKCNANEGKDSVDISPILATDSNRLLINLLAEEKVKKIILPSDLMQLISKFIGPSPSYFTYRKEFCISKFMSLFVGRTLMSRIANRMGPIVLNTTISVPEHSMAFVSKNGNFIILAQENSLSVYDAYTHKKINEYEITMDNPEDIKPEDIKPEDIKVATDFCEEFIAVGSRKRGYIEVQLLKLKEHKKIHRFDAFRDLDLDYRAERWDLDLIDNSVFLDLKPSQYEYCWSAGTFLAQYSFRGDRKQYISIYNPLYKIFFGKQFIAFVEKCAVTLEGINWEEIKWEDKENESSSEEDNDESLQEDGMIVYDDEDFAGGSFSDIACYLRKVFVSIRSNYKYRSCVSKEVYRKKFYLQKTNLETMELIETPLREVLRIENRIDLASAKDAKKITTTQCFL